MNKIDVSVNGQWISEVIPGFTVTSISGRELHPRKIRDEAIKGIDGSRYLGSEFPVRNLEIEFFILAKNNVERGRKYNELASLLNFEEGKVVFSDEIDKYFIGTPTGSNHKTITFECSDPFKYATTLKEFELKNGTITIQNNGSVPVPIQYDFSFTKDCGYLGIASTSGAMEFGRRDELDYEETKGDQTLLKWSDFLKAPDRHDYPPGYDHNWDASRYHYPHGLEKISSGTNVQWGAGGDNSVKEFLQLNRSDGVPHQGDWICGAFRMVDIPADANGEVGALDWTIYSFHWFEAGRMGECGEQEINVYTADNHLIAHFGLFKIDSSGNTGQIAFSGPSGRYKLIDFDTNWSGPFGSGNRGHNRITKRDDWVEFYYNGQNFRYHDPVLKTMKAAKVLISVSDNLASSKQMTINRITNVDFTKFNVVGKRDVVNTFTTGDSLLIDGETGKVYKKGMYRPELEILGSKFFKADPGQTEVKVIPSSWYAGTLSGRARIREAWL